MIHTLMNECKIILVDNDKLLKKYNVSLGFVINEKCFGHRSLIIITLKRALVHSIQSLSLSKLKGNQNTFASS